MTSSSPYLEASFPGSSWGEGGILLRLRADKKSRHQALWAQFATQEDSYCCESSKMGLPCGSAWKPTPAETCTQPGYSLSQSLCTQTRDFWMQFTRILRPEQRQSTLILQYRRGISHSPWHTIKILLLSPHSLNGQMTGQDPSLTLGKASPT